MTVNEKRRGGLRLRVTDSETDLVLDSPRLVVAGYTGRDAAAVTAHIDELAAIGVPPPDSVPEFYDLDPNLSTTESVIELNGSYTSGEVEPVLIRCGGRYYLGVGSDHTDRSLERTGIAAAKAACPKPLGERVLALSDDPNEFGPDWDRIALTCSVDGQAYQSGTLAALRTPADLLGRLNDAIGPIGGDLLVYAGTLPLLTGDFRPGTDWRVRLATTDGHELTHSYTVRTGRGEHA